jgi:predicted Zn-dependent peptidase
MIFRRARQRDFSRLVYGDQPAGWDVGGEKAIIKRLARADFVAYRARRYVMPGTVVVVAGKFGTASATRADQKIFRANSRAARRRQRRRQRNSNRRRRSHCTSRSRIRRIWCSDSARSTCSISGAMRRVLADLLGGGMSSRLFTRIREKMGAAYYIGAGTDLSLDHGLLSISAGVDRSKIEPVITAILEECAALRDEAVTEKELQKTKDHMIGGLVLGLETSDDLASFHGSQEVLTGGTTPPAVLAARIKKVTARDVQAVAKAIFKDAGLNLAIVGPYKEQARFKKILRLPKRGK